MARPELKLPTDPVPWRPLNVYVTREVAFDLKKMNEITAKVLGRAGCPECHSGRIINYHILENFVVNPKTLELEDIIPGGGFGG